MQSTGVPEEPVCRGPTMARLYFKRADWGIEGTACITPPATSLNSTSSSGATPRAL